MLLFNKTAITEKNLPGPFLPMNERKDCICLILPALTLVVVLIMMSGCIQSQKTPSGMPMSTEYAFIDHQTYTDGRSINGSYPALMIDFPTYRFDTEKVRLKEWSRLRSMSLSRLSMGKA